MKTLKLSVLISVLALSLGACVSPTEQPEYRPQEKEQPAKSPEASIALEPSSLSLAVDETASVNIVMDTQGNKVSTADVIMNYDPEVLEVSEIQTGAIFENYPEATIDAENGKLTIRAASWENAFEGKDTFATLNIKGLAAGSTEMAFEATPGSTLDTDIMELTSATDILKNTTNATISVE